MHVLITGANRGIGRGLYQAYSHRGDRATGTTRGAATGLGMLSADVADPASIRAMAERYGDQPLDLLICNAGVYPAKGADLADGYASEDWAHAFAVNVTGVYLTIQSLLPNLRAAKGKIAILASVMGSQSRAPGGAYIYRASKAAAINLGRNLAADLAPEGIAVGLYHPGWVQTDMGGAGAAIDTATSVAGLVARFDALSVATTGIYEDYAGVPIPF